jgi:predicted nucleotidyltransferase
MPSRIEIDPEQLEALCKQWKIKKVALFGSALRDDFRPDSDVDLLVDFDESANWSLFDHVAMEEDFSESLGRKVDLISRRAVEQSQNPIRRNAILTSAELIYAAG